MNSDVDKLDIDNLKNVSNNLSNLQGKVDKLDVDKLVPVPIDLTLIWVGFLEVCFEVRGGVGGELLPPV